MTSETLLFSDSISKWYDTRIQSGKRWRPIRFYHRFADLVQSYCPDNDFVVHDAGCGTGEFLQVMSDRGYPVFGNDISPKSIEIATRNVKQRESIWTCGMENLPEIEYADIVTAMGSLEHCVDIDAGLTALYNIGTKDATYFIMVPNSRFLFAGTDQEEINETLKTLGEWRRQFFYNGFQEIGLHKDLGLADKCYGLKSKLIEAAFKALPLRYTYQFIFVLRKRPKGTML